MSDRKAFPLRLEPETYTALQRWADAEFRSLNAQIEFVLRRALSEAGRLNVTPQKNARPSPRLKK